MSNHERTDTELAAGVLLQCLRCGLPAEISDRFTLAGAPRPVEHVKVVCVRRHWFVVPVEMISRKGTEQAERRIEPDHVQPRKGPHLRIV